MITALPAKNAVRVIRSRVGPSAIYRVLEIVGFPEVASHASGYTTPAKQTGLEPLYRLPAAPWQPHHCFSTSTPAEGFSIDVSGMMIARIDF